MIVFIFSEAEVQDVSAPFEGADTYLPIFD